MKKQILTMIALCGLSNMAYGANCILETMNWSRESDIPSTVTNFVDSAGACSSSTYTGYGVQCGSGVLWLIAVHSCSSCSDGYGATSQKAIVGFWDDDWRGVADTRNWVGGYNDMYDRDVLVDIINCEKIDCKSSDGCDTEYHDYGTGYQRKSYSYECLRGCYSDISYRCAVGYYGSSTNGTSGCTRCPASDGAYGTTGTAGATSVSACYIPSGTTFTDDTGSGTYTDDCNY